MAVFVENTQKGETFRMRSLEPTDHAISGFMELEGQMGAQVGAYDDPNAFKHGALRAAAKRNHAMWSVGQEKWVIHCSTAVALGVHNRVIERLVEKCADVEMFVD